MIPLDLKLSKDDGELLGLLLFGDFTSLGDCCLKFQFIFNS